MTCSRVRPDRAISRRRLVGTSLIVVDIALALLLSKRFSAWVGVAVFLNPISMIITGYHSQFDNLAVLLAFAGVAVGFPWSSGLRRRLQRGPLVAGLLLLGLSLTVKHLFFLLPFWLALRASRWRDRLLILTVPYLVFVGSFVPYAADGGNGIMKNVIDLDPVSWTRGLGCHGLKVAANSTGVRCPRAA